MTYNDITFLIGKRIEIPVHYDAWMQGARYGYVTGIRRGRPGASDYLIVDLDRRPKKCLKLWAMDCECAKIIS